MNRRLGLLLSVSTGLVAAITAGCQIPVEDESADHDSLAMIGDTAAAVHCTDAQGEEVVLRIEASDGGFDLELSNDEAVILARAAQRPALNARLEDGATLDVHEYLQFIDAGLTAIPPTVDPRIELDLGTATKSGKSQIGTLTVKTTDVDATYACSGNGKKLQAFLGIEKIKKPSCDRAIEAVAFDIDDTLLFSSPAIARGFATGGTPVDADEIFWTQVNGCDRGCDATTITLPSGETKELPANEPSAVKSGALALVAWHMSQGHRVYAITARPSFNGDALRAYIEESFGIAQEDVFFEPSTAQPGNPAGKTDRIEALALDIFYGDSDSDVTDAMAAFPGDETKKVLPIRFLRSPRSSNRKAGVLGKYHPGYFGEAIIANSYN